MNDTLERFRTAHAWDYAGALEEIRQGEKRSHWIWYIFPQIRGLGYSATAQYYEIRDRAEAEAYWADPMLSAHLKEISAALLEHHVPIRWIMDPPDDLKLRSSMTLFYLVTGEPLFKAVLDQFFGGELDGFTVQMLEE